MGLKITKDGHAYLVIEPEFCPRCGLDLVKKSREGGRYKYIDWKHPFSNSCEYSHTRCQYTHGKSLVSRREIWFQA